jgi:type I restriction enzyme R subunit
LSRLSADYVLVYKNRNLAVIEAKKDTLAYNEGVGQAKDYAERLNIRYTYSTNGKRIYQIDMQEGIEGEVSHYPTPDELWEMTFPKVDTTLDKLFAVPFETKGGAWQPRYYQENAITKTLEAVADDQKRILLTLATGTGKTAIAFQIAWKLFHAKWNLKSNNKKDFSRSPRILFLADRNILADQAFNSFGAFEEDALVRIDPSEIRKKGSVSKNGNIFFTIFQTFMSGQNETPYFGEYPEDFFDFIIIDECHRGGANDESSWRAILDYFSPAFQLGLTATPRRKDNVDTYEYFGEPVYEYSLKEGVNDGFLTPFKVKEVATTGDKYLFTSDDEVLEGEVEEGREYSKEEQNKIIEIMEIERYKVQLFLNMMNQNEKTLVFCETQAHAAAIRDLINQEAKSKNPNYCHRVTANDGARGETQLKYFQDNEKSIPTILTTSRKLSTGVDAPEIKHIVLLRAVKSMVEFKQIVGRGTRLFDNKDYFTIYDFVEAYKHFSDPEWDGELPDPEPIEPKEPCKKCGERPCVCEADEKETCSVCMNEPCVCEKDPKGMIRIRLSKGKTLELDSMVKTSFYAPDGKPMSADEFLKKLFADIPKFFESEAKLREIWSKPNTRKQLLEELSENGYTHAQLKELKKLIKAQNSDIFDVLAYIAYHSEIVPRQKRAKQAEIRLKEYDPAKQEFLNFVLSLYVEKGVQELDDTRLKSLLELKYNSLHDAKEALGSVQSIRELFIGFQRYLYDDEVVNEFGYGQMVAEPRVRYGE